MFTVGQQIVVSKNAIPGYPHKQPDQFRILTITDVKDAIGNYNENNKYPRACARATVKDHPEVIATINWPDEGKEFGYVSEESTSGYSMSWFICEMPDHKNIDQWYDVTQIGSVPCLPPIKGADKIIKFCSLHHTLDFVDKQCMWCSTQRHAEVRPCLLGELAIPFNGWVKDLNEIVNLVAISDAYCAEQQKKREEDSARYKASREKLIELVVKGIMDNMPECSLSMDCEKYDYNRMEFHFRDREDGKLYVVDKEKLFETFKLISSDKWPAGLIKPPEKTYMMTNEEEMKAWEDWLCQSDAESFDSFIQLACFGEVIFA